MDRKNCSKIIISLDNKYKKEKLWKKKLPDLKNNFRVGSKIKATLEIYNKKGNLFYGSPIYWVFFLANNLFSPSAELYQIIIKTQKQDWFSKKIIKQS